MFLSTPGHSLDISRKLLTAEKCPMSLLLRRSRREQRKFSVDLVTGAFLCSSYFVCHSHHHAMSIFSIHIHCFHLGSSWPVWHTHSVSPYGGPSVCIVVLCWWPSQTCECRLLWDVWGGSSVISSGKPLQAWWTVARHLAVVHVSHVPF